MADVVWTMEIPSSSSGELYVVQGLENGATTCTCRFGIMNREIPAGAKGCKHMNQALSQRGLGFQGSRLPVAWTDEELDFDSDAWVRRVCEIFSPVDYLRELVQATLREDNDHLERAGKRAAGAGSFRPHPLPELQRAVLGRLFQALSKFDRDDRVNSEAEESADIFLKKALRARQVPGVSNKQIAEAIRYSLCGNDTAWKRLVPDTIQETADNIYDGERMVNPPSP